MSKADTSVIPFDPESLLPMELVPMRVDSHVREILTKRLRALSPAQRQVAYRAILEYRLEARQKGLQQAAGEWVDDYERAIAAALKEKHEASISASA